MERRAPTGRAAAIAVAFLIGLIAELFGLLRGAGGDQPQRFSTLEQIGLWAGAIGLTALVVAWGAAKDDHPRLTTAAVAIAIVAWIVWLALTVAG